MISWIKRNIQAAFSKMGFRVVRNVVDPVHVIPELKSHQRRILHVASPHTMTTLESQWALLNAVRYIDAEQIEGDIVECGVWRGGNLIIAGLALEEAVISKKIWAYDTFEGMSSPTDLDRNTHSGARAIDRFRSKSRGQFSSWCYSPLEEVQLNVRTNVPSADVRYVKGKVEDTLKIESNLPKTISVLRLDTDWYESTKIELELLYPRLSKGGVLIIDDYGSWAGAKLATDEFFKDQLIWLHRVDRGCRLLIKPGL